MARAKRNYILIIKVNKLFSFFSSRCFLKEIENMYSVFLSSYTNTRESLGELEKAVETLACGSCSHSISRSPKLALVFVWLDRNTVHVFYFLNRGYYTGARRYEFYFRVAKQYFTNERSEWVKYCFCHEKIKFISSSRRVMFFLLYRHADDGVFDDFPKISGHLPKVSEDFQKLFRRPDERSRTFSKNFRRCPKIAEDCRRLSRKTRRCFDDTPTNLSTI